MSSAYTILPTGTRHSASRILRYMLIRAVTLLVTVVVAVYLTILIANFGSHIDQFIFRCLIPSIASVLVSHVVILSSLCLG